MGMGVAGSYLLSRLKNDHDVTGYERMTEERHDSICAWGSSKNRMAQLCKMSGIDFEKYVIHDGKFMHISCAGKKFDIALHGLCTYDKIGLIQDLVKDCTVHYGKALAKDDLTSKYDLVVDCTGFHRTIVKTVGRPIRLATPENCMPYSDGNIVGVGESIGTVFPLLGEGIIPSMECADILVDNVGNIAEYERQVAKHFAIYGTVYDFVRKKIDGKFNPVTQIANMLAIFRYMKRNEDRFGMDIKLRHLAKVAQA